MTLGITPVTTILLLCLLLCSPKRGLSGLTQCLEHLRGSMVCEYSSTVLGTFEVEDADLSKELALPEHGVLSDPVVGHHSQLAFPNDVHLVTHVPLLGFGILYTLPCV